MRNFLRQGRRDGSARTVFVPGEDVLLLSVTLPPMPAAQRRAAVAFAVEDRIARPLDEVHVILGPALDDAGHWLVAVVGRACMAAHLARLRPGPGVRVLPDTLTVPVPPPGHWAAREEAGRVLLRMADGTGMVLRADTLEMLHRLAGRPVVLHRGGVLPEGIALVPAPEGVIALPIGPDLRTAAAAEGHEGLPRLLRRVAGLVAVAGAVHLALLGAETLVLSQRLTAREVALRAALSEVGLSPEGDIEATLARAMAERQGPGAPAGFVAVLTQAMTAMGPLAGQATLRDLRFDGAQVAMTVQAPDMETLQAVETALNGASLGVVAGTATTADGLAEQQLTVTR